MTDWEIFIVLYFCCCFCHGCFLLSFGFLFCFFLWLLLSFYVVLSGMFFFALGFFLCFFYSIFFLDSFLQLWTLWVFFIFRIAFSIVIRVIVLFLACLVFQFYCWQFFFFQTDNNHFPLAFSHRHRCRFQWHLLSLHRLFVLIPSSVGSRGQWWWRWWRWRGRRTTSKIDDNDDDDDDGVRYVKKSEKSRSRREIPFTAAAVLRLRRGGNGSSRRRDGSGGPWGDGGGGRRGSLDIGSSRGRSRRPTYSWSNRCDGALRMRQLTNAALPRWTTANSRACHFKSCSWSR